MSPDARTLAIITTSFPRVSGDEPRWVAVAVSATLFSPRERG